MPIETIIRRAGAPVENVAKSFHDDYIEKNAKFRNDAGVKCYLVRTTNGKCCSWCSKIAGRYDYATAPEDIFRRHDNCACQTIKGIDKSDESGILKDNNSFELSVTDDAINSVPYVSIPGFTEEQNIKIQESHKNVLRKVQRKGNA